MQITASEFVKSSYKIDQLPPHNYPEYAFVGRSNVGKSSLINKLCGRKSLAKISSTPGKTQLINHFLINESWYLVDLPGYGYASVSKKKRANFGDMIFDYLMTRRNLMCVFVLIDSRHKPQTNDLEFLEFLGVKGIPFSILFTKIDKLNQKEFSRNLKNYKHKLLESWEELPHMIYTSAVSGRGMNELGDYIEGINPLFKLPE
ncbi:MAG: ribosome biogenesis GTP-binding protein YihA/YsxC [Bacteroidota bacterium]